MKRFNSTTKHSARLLNRVVPVLLAVVASTSCGVAPDRAGAAADAREPSVTWSPTAVLSGAGGGAAPVIAQLHDGRRTLAWVSAPDGGADGRLFVRPNAGADPTTEFRDPLGSLDIYGEEPPKIAYAPDGSLYAAYLVTKIIPGMRWPQNTLRFVVSHDSGAHWSAPTSVASNKLFSSFDDHALHVAADGAIYLSWLAEIGMDTSHTYFARSTDEGRHWSAPKVIDADRSCPCCRTAMTSGPDGTLYVAWRKRFPGEERDIVVARSADRGESWSVPVRVHADAWHVTYCPDAGPSIKVGVDGRLHVAWWTGKEGRAGTQYTQSNDRGATFAVPVELGLAQYSRAAHVQLALGTGSDSGLVVAAWDDGTRRVPQIVVRVSRNGGTSFSPADAISDPQRDVGYPVVGLAHDTVEVAWQERPLAAAVADSMAMSKKDKNAAMTYMNAVGALQIVVRRGVIAHGTHALSSRDASFRPIAVGDPMPSFAVRTLTGDTVRFGGVQPITVLNVWATWCTSCREEMADLEALQREFAGRGVRVVAVSVDAGDGLRVRRYAEAAHLSFVVAHDPEQRVERAYQTMGVPETFVIGSDGRLLWRRTGDLHDVVDTVRNVIWRVTH